MIDQLSINECMVAFFSPGYPEMAIVALIALLLYGGNLPEVARSWGKSFAEFRRGLSGFQNELNEVIYSEPDRLPYHSDDDDPSRDDSRIVHGYEESDDYEANNCEDDTSKEFQHDQCVQDLPDDSDQTVKDFGSDTVVIEPDQAAADEGDPSQEKRDEHA